MFAEFLRSRDDTSPGTQSGKCLEVILEIMWRAYFIITHWSALAEGNMQGTEASPSLYILQAKQLLQLQTAEVKL